MSFCASYFPFVWVWCFGTRRFGKVRITQAVPFISANYFFRFIHFYSWTKETTKPISFFIFSLKSRVIPPKKEENMIFMVSGSNVYASFVWSFSRCFDTIHRRFFFFTPSTIVRWSLFHMQNRFAHQWIRMCFGWIEFVLQFIRSSAMRNERILFRKITFYSHTIRLYAIILCDDAKPCEQPTTRPSNIVSAIWNV